jgi:cyclin A
MVSQPQINADTRGCVVDWMAGLLLEWRTNSTCLFLAVSILDRYLTVRPIAIRKVKLAALGALWIARKYVDGMDQCAAEWLKPSGTDFEPCRLLEMEADMCKVLGFRISHVTTDCFLSKFDCIPPEDEHIMHLAMFLAEISLLDYNLLLYAPSELAAGSLYIALCATHGPEAWTDSITAATGYSPAELSVLVRRLERVHGAVLASITGQYIRRKYSSSRYQHVAQLELKRST